jgi:hypothetical protein
LEVEVEAGGFKFDEGGALMATITRIRGLNRRLEVLEKRVEQLANDYREIAEIVRRDHPSLDNWVRAAAMRTSHVERL